MQCYWLRPGPHDAPRDPSGDSKGRILEGTTGLKSGGFLQAGVAVKTANFTLDDTFHTAIVNTGAADVTVTVPSFSTIPGRSYVLIKGDTGIGKIILDAFGAELINGLGTFDGTATQHKRIDFVNDGAAGYAKGV